MQDDSKAPDDAVKRALMNDSRIADLERALEAFLTELAGNPQTPRPVLDAALAALEQLR